MLPGRAAVALAVYAVACAIALPRYGVNAMLDELLSWLVLLIGSALIGFKLGQRSSKITLAVCLSIYCIRLPGNASVRGPRQPPATTVDANEYYAEVRGHRVPHLEAVVAALRPRDLVFLAGDSSLDNKLWIKEWAEAINGYEDVLDPPIMKLDVAYAFNSVLAPDFAAVNAAVEFGTISERERRRPAPLLPQDLVVVEQLRARDVLVISVGANDVISQPTILTALAVAAQVFAPRWLVDRGWVPGTAILDDLFGRRLERYARRLTARTMPRAVVVCMIYFPLTLPQHSWAGTALWLLRYDSSPELLQTAIRGVYERAVRHITVPGTVVVPLPLFEALNETLEDDYVHRVEPSAEGGRKMAALIARRLTEALPDSFR